MASGISALDLRHVSAGYGETVVLEDINLSLDRGESISVIGRNGVGKTTLLHVIAGVAVPKKLSKEQKHLLEELSKTLPQQEDDFERGESGEKPFFERVKDIFG